MALAINLIIDTPTRINISRGWETERDKRNRALWLDHLCNWLAFLNMEAIQPANDLINQRAYRHIHQLEQRGLFADD